MRRTSLYIAGLAAAAAAVACFNHPVSEPIEAPPAPVHVERETVSTSVPVEPLRPRLESLAQLHAAAQADRSMVDAYLRARARAIESADIDALIESARDENPAVRMMAVQLLGAVGGDRALAAILDVYRSGENAFRLVAAHAIAGLEGADSVPALLEILRAGPGATTAAEALGRRGDDRAVAPLIAAMQDESDLSRACHAATAPGRPGGPAARLAREQTAAARTHVTVRRAAETALTRFEESQ